MLQSLGKLKQEFTALGLAALILLGVSLTGINPLPGPSVPEAEYRLGASEVVIKTQEAADSVPGGIRGIDVSKYQGSINWERVAQDDVKFVMARASIGTETDETFIRNAQGAHDNGIMVGAYHYAKFTNYNTMLAEARTFIDQLNQVRITYPVALDVEAHRNIKRSELTRLCLLFMEEVKSAGYDVMLYTYNNFLISYLDRNALDGYKLWIANYIAEPNFGQSIWQHTSYGSVRGISGRVDINIAYEDLSKNKVIRVNATVSRSIRETLNERYSAGLSMDVLDLAEVERAVANGLQLEVNKQFGVDLAIYDQMSESALEYLERIDYVKGTTKGNITYLIQVKLFYKGLYTGYPTAEYDEATAQAVQKYQQQFDIHADGQLNPATIDMLLR